MAQNIYTANRNQLGLILVNRTLFDESLYMDSVDSENWQSRHSTIEGFGSMVDKESGLMPQNKPVTEKYNAETVIGRLEKVNR